MYNIHLLPATFGDSILVEYGETKPHYILIDGGPYYAIDDIFAAIKKKAPGLEELELLIITHIDIDHIDGVITLLNSDLPFRIKEVWFNGAKEIRKSIKDDTMGPLQGEYLSMLITKKKLVHNKKFTNGVACITDYSSQPDKIELDGGMIIRLLSPGIEDLANLLPEWEAMVKELGDEDGIKARWKDDKRYDGVDNLLGDDLMGEEQTIEELQEFVAKPDKSAANRSSIAFIAEYKGTACLLAGDATTACLTKAIDSFYGGSLIVDAWKLSHHGSKKSTLDSLMQKIKCKKALISSDGKRYKHPDKECIAKLLKYQDPDLSLYFNYRSDFNETWDDKEKKKAYKYNVHYPAPDEQGITVDLME